MKPHRTPLWVALILLMAAGLRLSGLSSNTNAVLADDHLDYHRIAASLLAGNGYVQVEGYAYGRQPGWPVFLTGVYALGGPSPQVGVWATALLGVISVALTFRIAFTVFNQATAYFATFLVAIDPFLIVQDQTLLSESLYTVLLLTFVWLIIRNLRRNPIRSAALGLFIGLAILVRSNGIAFLFALPLVRLRLRALILVGGVCLLILAPWIIRNLVVTGSFTPFAPQTGQLLLGSYNQYTRDNPEAFGLWLYPRELAEGAPFADLPYLEREAAWTNVALTFIRENVASLPAMIGRRVARFLILPAYLPRAGLESWLPIQPVYYLFLVTITATSILTQRRGRYYTSLIISLFLPAILLAAVLYGEARFRAPYQPLFAILSAAFLAGLAEEPQERGA